METQNSAPDARELKKRAAAAGGGIERRQARLESPLTHALSRQAERSFRRGPPPLGVRMRIVFRKRHRQNRLGSERRKAGPGCRGGRKACGPWTGNCALKSRPTESFRTTRGGTAKVRASQSGPPPPPPRAVARQLPPRPGASQSRTFPHFRAEVALTPPCLGPQSCLNPLQATQPHFTLMSLLVYVSQDQPNWKVPVVYENMPPYRRWGSISAPPTPP